MPKQIERMASPIPFEDVINQSIGERIRMMRKITHMTQTELANKLGISFQSVQKYEKGDSSLTMARMIQIAQVFGLTPSFFYESIPQVEGQPSFPYDVNKFITRPDIVKLLTLVLSIKNKDSQKLILGFLTQMVHNIDSLFASESQEA